MPFHEQQRGRLALPRFFELTKTPWRRSVRKKLPTKKNIEKLPSWNDNEDDPHTNKSMVHFRHKEKVYGSFGRVPSLHILALYTSGWARTYLVKPLRGKKKRKLPSWKDNVEQPHTNRTRNPHKKRPMLPPVAFPSFVLKPSTPGDGPDLILGKPLRKNRKIRLLAYLYHHHHGL